MTREECIAYGEQLAAQTPPLSDAAIDEGARIYSTWLRTCGQRERHPA